MGERWHRARGVTRLKTMAATAALAVTGTGLIAMVPATAAHAGPAVKSAPMAYIGSDGRIAFVRKGNIFSIKPDGTGLRKLTHHGHASGPRWSPNGTRLAFIDRGNLWIMNANGSKKRRITGAAPRYTDGRPTWSPNGRYLAFVKTFRHRSFGYLTRYDTVTGRFVSFTAKINMHQIRVAALAATAVAWQWALNATGQAFGSFLIYEGANRQCIGKRFCLDTLGFGQLNQFRHGFPSAESDHSTPTRLTDPDWFPIRPHFATDVLTTVENCTVLPCTHSGLMLQITSATTLPGAYEGVWAPLGDQIAFVKNVRGVPQIFRLKISPVAEFSPVFVTDGTEPDWQPTAPFPPLPPRPSA
jgi:hypothetical protein